MSKYLLSGAKMLQYSCPDCHIPLIQEKKNNKVFCANCLREVKYVQNEQEAQIMEERLTITQNSKGVLTDLEAILMGKLQNFSLKISSESDLDQYNNLLEATLKTLKIILILRKMNNSIHSGM
ncbi:MAG: Sjogren's syndrome/scleroderma autoantigen 1 family protein [Candidatus Thorarchaeota archaeon]